MTQANKPAPASMTPFVSPFPEISPEIELWTATTDHQWCLKLYYVEDIFKVRGMWQKLRQLWITMTLDGNYWPPSLWFSAWLLSELGIRAWKGEQVSLQAPDSLQRVQNDWRELDKFLQRKLEQQAAHDIKVGMEVEHRAFLLCSMLAILANIIKQQMPTWTYTTSGKSFEEEDVALIQEFAAKMNKSDYRDPIRPISMVRIQDWQRRQEPPMSADYARRWAQMPFT